jgi:hypothetical protein
MSARPYEYARRDIEWDRIPPGCLEAPRPPATPPSLREQFEALRWVEISADQWRGVAPTPGLPFATHWSRKYANGHLYTVYKLNTGEFVFDVGARDEFSAPPISG